MNKFEIEFYETVRGGKPAWDFLLSLDKKMRAKMASMISLLQENGYELREPYSKYLSEGIFELRAKVGSDITRVLYFFYVDRKVILTNGYIKKTRKTPVGEIKKAKKISQRLSAEKGGDGWLRHLMIFCRNNFRILSSGKNMKHCSLSVQSFRQSLMLASNPDLRRKSSQSGLELLKETSARWKEEMPIHPYEHCRDLQPEWG